MKQYSLKSPNKIHKIGRISFTFDKAFFTNFSKNPKYVPANISVFLISGEDENKLIQNLTKDYKNARNFQVIKFNEVEKIIENRS